MGRGRGAAKISVEKERVICYNKVKVKLRSKETGYAA